MSECTRCGTEVAAEDVVRVEEKEICEDCYMTYYNPSKPCGGHQ